MPYSRQSDKQAYMQAYMREYNLTRYLAQHPEKKIMYHRNAILRRAILNGRPPSHQSIQKYRDLGMPFTDEELNLVAQRMMHKASQIPVKGALRSQVVV